MNLVVDASVAIKWFVREAGHEEALALLAPGIKRHAPGLVIAETANILWKKCILGEIDADQAEAAILALPAYFAETYRSDPLASRALEVALRLNHPVYDCLYLAYAERIGGPLVTADRRLVTAVEDTEWEPHLRFLDDRTLPEAGNTPENGP